MSSHFSADTFDEATDFIRGLREHGYSGFLKYRRAGKFIVETAWGGKKYHKFVSHFKGRRQVRELTSMMEQEGLL
jgi:hypothetical protein